MKNRLIYYLIYFCLIVIFQEKGDSQSVNPQISIFVYGLPVWILFVEMFLGNVKIQKRKVSKIFSDLIILYLIVFTSQSILIFANKGGSFVGTFYWSNLRLFAPLISVYLISLFYPISITLKQLLNSIDFLFYGCILALSSKVVNLTGKPFEITSILLFGNSPLESDTLCFAFGLITAHFFYKGEKKKFLWSLLFVLLTGKRIVFLGLLIFFFLNIDKIKKWIFNNVKIFGFILLACNIGYAYFLYDMGSGQAFILEVIEASFTKNANDLTMGRMVLYERIIESLGAPNFLGNGMGSVMFALRRISTTEEWLHSDILMNFYEIGILGCLGWLFFLFFKFKETPFSLSLLVLFDVFMLTDNTFYYFVPNFIFYYLVFVNSVCLTKQTNVINN
ncbi:hypothetical protein ACWA1C_22165 [Flectobacillus roseus]